MESNEFKYGDIESSSFGLFCGTETHSMLPEKRKYVQEIPGLDGVADFGISGYAARIITKPVYFTGSFAELRRNRENIIAWLYNNGTPKKLIFGNEPDRYYMAKVYAALEFENASDRHIGDIQFECNPPWQYLSDGTILTPEEIVYINCTADGGQYIKEFSGSGSIKFYNKGTQSVKPIIKIIGRIKSGISLIYKNAEFKLETDRGFDGVEINCAAETVKQMSDGENLYQYIASGKDNFFSLSEGKCEISVAESNIGEYPDSFTVIVQFAPILRG